MVSGRWNRPASSRLILPVCLFLQRHKEKAMFTKFGVPELLILLVLVVLLFGVGRIGKIASELGSALRSFRENLKDKKEEL